MNHKKKPLSGDALEIILIAVMVVVAIAITAALVHFAKNRPSAYAPVDTTEAVEETKQVPMPTASGTEAIQAETTPAETTALQPETTEAETVALDETSKLQDLSGYKPGDSIDEERLDMNDLSQYFVKHDITVSDAVYARINGKSYRDNPNVSLDSLTYVTMPHYNFDGNVQMGEMLLNKDIADDAIAVFEELFQNKYQIRSMYLVDNYWTGDGDSTDYASIDVDNTSCFNYRAATGSSKLSNHAYGRAIDLNPQENPYVTYQDGKAVKWAHENANDYIDRTSGKAHVITHDDLAYKVFTAHGFRWGGDWNSPKDFQHFDKAK